MSSNQAKTETAAALAADLIWGADAIAEALNLTKNQVYHQLEDGLLPAKKQGRLWVSSHSALRAHFADMVAADAAGKAA